MPARPSLRALAAALLFAAALSPAGCTGQGTGKVFAPLLFAEAVTVINTDKTIADQVASLVSGKDCSTLRWSDGGVYCREWYVNDPVVPTLYCYRTLGEITCYDRPSSSPGDRLVGIRPGGQLPIH